MDDNAAFNALMMRLDSARDAADMSELTEPQRNLTAFAKVMSMAWKTSMGDLVWQSHEQAVAFADAFEAIGASDIAKEIVWLAAQDEYSGYARRRAIALNDRVHAERQALWSLALEYAGQSNVLPRQD